MTVGIVGYGAYLPRLRLSRRAVTEANAWFAPGLAAKARGTRSLANWDEDSLTMAVAAARDCLGRGDDRGRVRSLMFASTTAPFAERLNAAVIAGALTLDEEVDAVEVSGSQRAGVSALAQASATVRAGGGDTLVVAADSRLARPASAQELDYGDGAAAILFGTKDVLAEHLGGASLTVDFVDRFRMAGEDFDYTWEERWVRDEGVSKLAPRAIAAALAQAGVAAADVSHFVMPSSLRGMDKAMAAACGVAASAVGEDLLDRVGDTGVPHPLLLLARRLETARPGEVILVAQFGSGAQAVVFRVTDAIDSFRPVAGVGGWLDRGVEETSYTKFLSFKGLLEMERGMRGEQDHKTALSTAYRHRAALLGLVAGRCEETGDVVFPPSRLSYSPQAPLKDTQRPYKLAERRARVLSWSAESLSFHRAPPHTYGQVDFEGGGRILMEFTDVAKGEVEAGTEVEMAFRIKAVDDRRNFTRYFWKAVPVRPETRPAPPEEV